jgi:nucleotide-binding universal stress UspA family protein
MKAILCALDFSEASDQVIKVALEIAAQKQTHLVVLYAYRLIQPKDQDIAEYRKGIETRAQEDFLAIVKRLQINGAVPYEFRSEIGFLSDRIEVFLKKNKVDIIVMSQNLAHNINEHNGLTFEHFLDTTKIPVLVVPEMFEAA